MSRLRLKEGGGGGGRSLFKFLYIFINFSPSLKHILIWGKKLQKEIML